MGKIIAIGGGEISRAETLKIDRRIIKLSGRKRPKFLFMPTASSDSAKYIEAVKKYGRGGIFMKYFLGLFIFKMKIA